MNEDLDALLRTASDDLRVEAGHLNAPEFEPRPPVGRVAAVTLAIACIVGGAFALGIQGGQGQTVEPADVTPDTTASVEAEPEAEQTDSIITGLEGLPPVPELPAAVDLGAARTDRATVGLPEPLSVAAGESLTDPLFGTEMVRLTDGPSGSTITPGLAGTQVFNADSSLFLLYDSSAGNLILYRTADLNPVRRISLNSRDQHDFVWHPTDPDALFYTDRESNTIVQRSVSTDDEEVVLTAACDAIQFASYGRVDAQTGNPGFICQRGADSFWSVFNVTERSIVVAVEPISGLARSPISIGGGLGSFVVVEDEQILILDTELAPTEASPVDIAAKAIAMMVDETTGGPVLVVTDYNSDDAAMAAVIDPLTGDRRNLVSESLGDLFPPNGIRMSSGSGQGLVAVAGRGDRDRALDGELMLLDPSGLVIRLAHHRMEAGDFGDLNDAIVKLSPDQSVLLFSSNLGGDSIDTFAIRLN